MARPDVPVTVRPWPHDPTIGHLVLLDLHARPDERDVDAWVARTFADDPTLTRVRTGALFPAVAATFERCGFTVADRLALLERSLPRTGRPARPDPPSSVRLRTLRRRDLPVAARIDTAAFPVGWGNDTDALVDVARATPVSIGRLATIDRTPVAFAITGKAGATAYLQRLAVHPDHQRSGLARVLVDDAIHRMTRRGAAVMIVNTGIDNDAALALYHRAGFHRRPDELVVMERRR